MAINPDIENGPFIGNGAQAAFAFTFTAVTPAEVAVLLDGVVQSAGYTVALAEGGGTVTFATPPAAGARVLLRSSPDYLQDSVFENEGAYNLATINTINRRQAVRALVTKKRLDATSVAAADASADAAAVSAAAAAVAAVAAAGSASAASGAAGAAGTSAASAAGSAAAAAGSVNGAALAAATAGAYPNSAASFVPRGLTQASVGAITAGSGGTNGTFALAWSGGNFAINPTGTFTVAGGVLTAVTITGPGLYIGAAPAVPTPSFAASAGLTGAALTLTAQFLVASGQGYWVQSADGSELDRYANVGGAATTFGGVGPVPISGATATTAQIIKGRGRKSLFRDPFFRNNRLPTYVTLLPGDDTYYDVSAGWTAGPASASNPYSDVYELRGLAGSYRIFTILLPRLGLVPGDAFAFALEIASASAPSIYLQYRGHSINYIGSTFVMVSGGTAPGSAGKVYKSADMIVPDGAFTLEVGIYSLADFTLRARWGHLGTAAQLPDGPLDMMSIPDGFARVASAEQQLPSMNGLVLKTVTSTARAVVVAGSPAYAAFNAYNGYGVILDSAAIPAGFNALEIPGGLVWEPGYNPPTTIHAVLRVGVGAEVPFIDGRLIGIGSITVDPTSGSIPQQQILYRDPRTGEALNPATILSQLGDHVAIGVYGLNAAGAPCERLYTGTGTTAYSSTPSAFGGYWRATDYGDIQVWSQSLGNGSVALSLVNLTNPREVYTTPAPSFGAAIAAVVDEAPSLIACPQKAYAIVGRETFLYYAPMMQRDWRRTNINPVYSAALSAGSGPRTEGWLLNPTSAGTSTLTLQASRGDILSDTKAITLVACAASAGAGTKRLLMMGDSLVEGNAGQTNITALSALDGVTNVINVGTKGSAPNQMEGYSGQALTAFLAATILSGAGSIANPFYNPATHQFDFGYYVTNSLGGTPPTHVLLEGGFWEVSHGQTDAQAVTGASTWAATAETIIASIAAYNVAHGTVIKTAVWTQPLQDSDMWDGDAQDGQDPASIGAAAGQLKRNMRTLAAKAISQFSGREASRIYVVPAGTCMDPETAYARGAYVPKNAAVAARYNGTPYATYAAMIADLSSGDETVTYCTDVARWFIKEGPPGKGHWRNVDGRDGFVRRITDGIHLSYGWRQLAQQIFAWIKNVP